MSRAKDRAAAVAALADQNWSEAEVDSEPRRVSVVHSARIPAELSALLEAEAERRGITPSKLIAELVAEGLDARRASGLVTVRVADLHRAIDSVIRTSAA